MLTNNFYFLSLSLSRKSNINTVRVSDSSVSMVEVGRGNLD